MILRKSNSIHLDGEMILIVHEETGVGVKRGLVGKAVMKPLPRHLLQEETQRLVTPAGAGKERLSFPAAHTIPPIVSSKTSRLTRPLFVGSYFLSTATFLTL